MRADGAMRKGCDALDLAAIWPSGTQMPGFPVPEIGSSERRKHESESQA